MEKEHIDNLILQMKHEGEKRGVQTLEIRGLSDENAFNLSLDINGEHYYEETDEEALSEIIKILELANHLNSRVLFYKIDTNRWENETGYSIYFYFTSEGIIYESDITFLDYIHVEEMEDKARDEKLKAIKDVIERVFGNVDFDSESIVKNSLLPYFERNNITHISRFTNLNPIINRWWEEIIEIENSANLVSDLVDYYFNDDKTSENDSENSNTNLSNTGFPHFLLCLVPYMYEGDKHKADEITEKIKRLGLSVYSEIRRIEATENGPMEVKKITAEFLDRRRSLGIRNQKVTKQEIEEYLRWHEYGILIPRELLKNAIFDIANKNEEDY
ncbi:MAG: hypothetical protein QXZ17_00040 [Nitrososphaerota archaeon]